VYKKNQSTILETEEKQWFQTWFNTPFYHILYNNRDNEEAEAFISKLINFLKPEPMAKVLDLACGTGRHSIMLSKLGLKVLGVDLSTASINEAKQLETSTLHFEEHDMRSIVKLQGFDLIFNLFTSFGYFELPEDNQRVLDACYSQLLPGGKLVLDYFNSEKILPSLPQFAQEKRGDLCFEIEKFKLDGQIVKSIKFTDGDESYHFEERVFAYSLAQLQAMILAAGFHIQEVFGNYALEKFDTASERVILIAVKK